MIYAVCQYYTLFESKLLVLKRGTENVLRDMVINLVRQHCREILPFVGCYFGIENYSTVSSVIERVKLKRVRNKNVQEEIETIGKKL